MRKFCQGWGYSEVRWKDANWPWDDCQLVEDLCKTWSDANVLWKNSNWFWNECLVVTDTCKWDGANVIWKDANWLWSKCPVIDTTCKKWKNTSTFWKDANWLWSACSGSIPPIPPLPVIEIKGNQPGIDATTIIQPWLIEPWNPYRAGEKRKRLIKLICKVKGQEYEETKESKDFKIDVEDIKLVIQKISGIELDIK